MTGARHKIFKLADGQVSALVTGRMHIYYVVVQRVNGTNLAESPIRGSGEMRLAEHRNACTWTAEKLTKILPLQFTKCVRPRSQASVQNFKHICVRVLIFAPPLDDHERRRRRCTADRRSGPRQSSPERRRSKPCKNENKSSPATKNIIQSWSSSSREPNQVHSASL